MVISYRFGQKRKLLTNGHRDVLYRLGASFDGVRLNLIECVQPEQRPYAYQRVLHGFDTF